MSSSRLDLLIAHVDGARRYTQELLGTIDAADWFRMPPGGVTHIAWQVGHLATAQYRLVFVRVRGRRPDDDRLIPSSFQPTFGYGSAPSPDPASYPPIEEIRAVFDAVHREAIAFMSSLPDSELDAPALDTPPRFPTKQSALLWCGQHEYLHAGQIGLIRRLLGAAPVL